MEQTIAAPTAEELDRLEGQREWVRGHFVEEDRFKYSILSEKLRLLQTILDAGWIAPQETLKLQCLGVVLGDAFIQELGMAWVTVTDEYGCDPALQLPGTTVLIFPLTMISKRVESGEHVDVAELFNGVEDATRKAVERADKLH